MSGPRQHEVDGFAAQGATAGAGGAPQLDELTLMAGVAAQRMDAFEALYQLYHPRLSRFLQRILRRPELIEEVLDDTMVVVWNRAHAFVPDGKVSTWVFGIAYRQALKSLRQAGHVVAHQAEGDFDFVDPAPGPADLVQRQHQRDLIAIALDSLPFEQRTVVEMTYLLGYSCRDVAAAMGCPVDTVKSRMFYARKRMRALLDAQQEAI